MKNINKYLIALFFVIGLFSCGSEEYNTSTGSVTVRAVWPDEDIVSRSVSAAVIPPNINIVRVIVSSPGMGNMQNDFSAAAGNGTVKGIPAGANRTLTLQGLDSGGSPMYEGIITGITVRAGETTDAGIVDMYSITPPDSPLNVKAVAGDKEVTLNWNSVDGATSYNVYRDNKTGVSKTNNIDQISTSSLPYTWTGNENGAPLENGTTYYFVVTAVNSYGESDESVEVNATPKSSGPDCEDLDNDKYGVGPDCLGPDCNDKDENIHPGATEVCDNMDNDCNGQTDEGLVYTPTSCGEGECGSAGEMQCVNGGLVDTCVPGDPSTETCDDKDNDCDGQIDDEIADTPTTCGQGECKSAGVRQCVNGGLVDTCIPGSPSTEICNGIDDNCDGGIDEIGNALCDNGLYCDGQETCGGTNGCQNGSSPCASGEICSESTDSCEHTYAIGDQGPAGGIVFYIYGGGLHGLEAAPQDQSYSVAYGCSHLAVPGADGTATGTGAQNTANIVKYCPLPGRTNAAEIADKYTLNNYRDWFLPSKDELYLLYQHRAVFGIRLSGDVYWSSSHSKTDAQGAWHLHFGFGTESIGFKGYGHRVRAVREF